MERKHVVVRKPDWAWINKYKSDKELSSNAKVIDRLIRFYMKHEGIDPDFE